MWLVVHQMLLHAALAPVTTVIVIVHALDPRPHTTTCRELERQLAALRQQRAETEAALQRERAAGVGRQTAGELQEMITTLQVGV